MWNLLEEKYATNHERDCRNHCKNNGYNLKSAGRLSVGDKISFYAGMNQDIKMSSKIVGISNDKELFIVWECYWFPIKDELKRKITKI